MTANFDVFSDDDLLEDINFDADLDLDAGPLGDDDWQSLHSRVNRPQIFKPAGSRRVAFVNAAKAARQIKPMAEGERYLALLAGDFIMGDFIEAFLTEHGVHCPEMSIATLSVSQENVDSLELLMDKGYVDRLDLIVSGYFYRHERSKSGLIPYIYDRLDKGERFQMAVAASHAKNCLFITDRGNKYVIHGSANLRSNGCLEEIIFERSAEIYDWKKAWHDTVIKKYGTIKREFDWTEVQRLAQTIGG
jgi:hypothetical protein